VDPPSRALLARRPDAQGEGLDGRAAARGRQGADALRAPAVARRRRPPAQPGRPVARPAPLPRRRQAAAARATGPGARARSSTCWSRPACAGRRP
jgi:hypothetical protein